MSFFLQTLVSRPVVGTPRGLAGMVNRCGRSCRWTGSAPMARLDYLFTIR